MKLNLSNYRVVTIDAPIFCMDNITCAGLLGRALKMKVDGYSVTYGDRVLPLDKADFFGTHIMFCEQKDQELVPVFAYKATPLDRCFKFHYDFPIHSIIRTNEVHTSCMDSINKIIDTAKDPASVSFDSSWAQNLEYRFADDPELKEHIREIMMMVIVKHHQDFNIPHMITAGALKVKTDLFFKRMGLNMLNEHALFTEKCMDNAQGIIFYNNTFSFEALNMAKKYQDLWDKRLIIDGMAASQVKKVA